MLAGLWPHANQLSTSAPQRWHQIVGCHSCTIMVLHYNHTFWLLALACTILYYTTAICGPWPHFDPAITALACRVGDQGR